jgi:hypothetical protein
MELPLTGIPPLSAERLEKTAPPGVFYVQEKLWDG